jgi:hypothetical protein
MVFLTAAERQFLLKRRTEIAALLRDACLTKMLSTPRRKSIVNTFRSPTERIVPPSESSTFANLVQMIDERTDIDGAHILAKLVDLYASGLGSESPTAAELALASIWFDPTDASQILVAMDLAQRGLAEATIPLLQRIRTTTSDPAIRRSVLANLGFAFGSVGDRESAHAMYAGLCDEPFGLAWMNRFTFGVSLGNCEDIIECSKRLEEILTAEHPWVTWFVQSQRQLRRAGEWTVSTTCTQALARSDSRLDSVAGKLATIFT